MNIEAILNPEGERKIMGESTDEIYQAVINAIDACENINENGGDDLDSDGPVQVLNIIMRSSVRVIRFIL